MRRSRRGGGSHSDFASSGEDSFVAVVVTKLTGALLFILLLTMVIMALLPKAVDLGQLEKNTEPESDSRQTPAPLQIATPTTLPEAIAGRPYLVALAATGGRGPLHWSARGSLPEWLSLDEANGRIGGIPPTQTNEPFRLAFKVSDGSATATQPLQLTVLPGQASTTISEALRRLRWPSLSSRAWLEQGVGFLVLWLIHLLGMNLLANVARGSLEVSGTDRSGDEANQLAINKRFATYRLLLRLATLAAMTGLAAWLLLSQASTVS